MFTESRSERLQRLLNEVDCASGFDEATIETLTTAWKIGSHYMLQTEGIETTAKFLLLHKQFSLEQVTEYINRAMDKLDAKGISYSDKPPTIELHFNITDSFNTTITQTPPDAIKPIIDTDPNRFNKNEVYDLMDMLAAHKRWTMFLDDANYDLKQKERGAIDAKFVAFVGCLFRKNIRNNVTDPGAVPVKAVTTFCRSDKSFHRSIPDTRQITAACRLLEDVGFMKKVRCAVGGRNGNKGQCAAYQLLNENQWVVASAETAPASKQ